VIALPSTLNRGMQRYVCAATKSTSIATSFTSFWILLWAQVLLLISMRDLTLTLNRTM
jgi:hypothetical protein